MIVKLISDIEFEAEGNIVFIPQGTEIYLDSEYQFGILDDFCFDVLPDEYVHIN